MPALWEARATCWIFRWARRATAVSRKMGIRWEVGTDVLPPKPGLRLSISRFSTTNCVSTKHETKEQN